MATAIKAIPTLKGKEAREFLRHAEDDFFAHDATRYAHFLMGKTYCFRLGDSWTVVDLITLSQVPTYNSFIFIYCPRGRLNIRLFSL